MFPEFHISLLLAIPTPSSFQLMATMFSLLIPEKGSLPLTAEDVSSSFLIFFFFFIVTSFLKSLFHITMFIMVAGNSWFSAPIFKWDNGNLTKRYVLSWDEFLLNTLLIRLVRMTPLPNLFCHCQGIALKKYPSP